MLNKKGAALSQVGILIIAIIAFAFILNESSLVRADDCVINCEAEGKVCEAYNAGSGETKYRCVGGTPTGVIECQVCYAQGYECDAKNNNGAISYECVSASTSGEEDKKDYLGMLTKGLGTAGTLQQAYGYGTKVAGWFSSGSTAAEGSAAINSAWTGSTVTTSSSGGVLSSLLTANSGWAGVAELGIYAAIAIAAGIIATEIAGALGASATQAGDIGVGVGVGVMVGILISTKTILGPALVSGPVGALVGLAVASIIVLFTVKKESTDIVKYQCFPFVPDYGGEKCEECNNQEFPCTEYQCNNLGQSCQLLNKGTTDELCVFVGRNDTAPPIISGWETPLPDGYKYNPLTTTSNDRGVTIYNELNAGGCLRAFEDIEFGATLNEPAICKMSYDRETSFDEMGNEYFSRGVSRYNHSMHMSFPGDTELTGEGTDYEEGINEIFVRCKDAAGNENVENFVFKFCVDDKPDLAAPIIKDADPLDGAYIAFNKSQVDATFYINKPSTCKWDNLDMAYDQMGNEMSCVESIGDAVSHSYSMVYPCTTTLTGIQNYEENKYYIKCKSYPLKNESERILMEQSYEYNLFGSRELAIVSSEPSNKTVSGSSNSISVNLKVETFAGAENGKSICSFNDYDINGNYVSMFNTDAVYHSQELSLSPGDYTYHIKCVDIAGNIDYESISFTVESDTVSPLIARIYNKDGYLKIVTNEESTCVYSVADCSYEFDEGFQMNRESPTIHYTQWNTETPLYVKCEDEFSNQPLDVDQCSVIVRPYDEFIE